ncbi:hypothetical protein GVT64_13300 [Salmonella enterica]|nr:hypothetical protein [Salmonella enterica]
MCKHISDKLYDYIFTIGILWIMLFGKHQEKSLELIRKTPKENISNLCKELRLLDNEEKAFLVSILTIKLRAPHTSDANLLNRNGTFDIYSKKLLINNKNPFPERSLIDDIYFYLMTIFSLPWKQEKCMRRPRFGSRVHAVDIHQPVFEQVSCINLYDQHFPASPDAGKYIDGLSQEAVEILKKQDTSKYDFIFLEKI